MNTKPIKPEKGDFFLIAFNNPKIPWDLYSNLVKVTDCGKSAAYSECRLIDGTRTHFYLGDCKRIHLRTAKQIIKNYEKDTGKKAKF